MPIIASATSDTALEKTSSTTAINFEKIWASQKRSRVRGPCYAGRDPCFEASTDDECPAPVKKAHCKSNLDDVTGVDNARSRLHTEN